jgi:glycosyltransferase involved in cell wall biosynthesis
LNITLFIERAPPAVGGLQSVCLRIAEHFQDAEAKVKIIGFPARQNSSTNTHSLSWVHGGIKVVELSRGPREEFLFKFISFLKKRRVTFPLAVACCSLAYGWQITRMCRGSSVLHYFGTGMEINGYAVWAAAKNIMAKFVIEPAVHAGSCGDSWLDAPLYRKADLLLAHTDYEAGIIQNLGVPRKKIRTIVHGVDFCDSGDGVRFRGKHGIAGPMVLFLGRKTETKGIGRLLEAWPTVAEKFPDATLVLAGPKSADFENLIFEKQKAEIRNLLATGYPLLAKAPEALPQFLNLEDLSEGEKQDALAACNILCVPSEGESFGMVYFEAWAYQKPVIALDLPVLRETIGLCGGGLLSQPEPTAIARSLIHLLENIELQKTMGRLGHEAALRHDWPLALESYEMAYQDLICP